MTQETIEDSNYNDDEIDFKAIYKIISAKKFFIIILTSVFALLSILYALNTPNIYTSKTLLIPSTNEGSVSNPSLGGLSLSSVAGVAGLKIPSSNVPKSQEGIERIKSFEFFSTYFLPNIKLENIIAVKDWLPEKNILIYDDSLFDSNNKKWIRKASYPRETTPSSQEAFSRYKELLSIYQEKNSAFITISINHHSPYIAKKWLEIIVYEINESMRKYDEELASKSISYLNEVALSTNIQSIKEAITNLLETQIKKLMLTSSNESYVFKIIDSPIVPEEKSKPRRYIICLLGTLMGLILSLIIVFIQNYLKNKSTN